MRPFLPLVLLAAAGVATPNDGWVGYGGAPKLMKGHPTVRMVSERVVMLIKGKTMIVDCAFIFKNEGPATTVRMGFPDYDSDSYEGEPLKTTFDWFRSSVDGKRCPTKLTADADGGAWQVKTVEFKSGQTRRVRNVYEVRLGVLGLGIGGYVHTAQYILETGASWKGRIGRSEIVAVFSSGARQVPNELRKWPKSDDNLMNDNFWKSRPLSLLWNGPSKPRPYKNMVFFTRSKWEPKRGDDVDLAFGWRKTYDWGGPRRSSGRVGKAVTSSHALNRPFQSTIRNPK